MNMYDAYAPLYDGSGQIRFALLMAQYLREVLQKHPVSGGRMLDVACGTGTLALLMAEKGWRVVGLDSSEAMLAQARAKTDEINFIEGDMRAIPALAEIHGDALPLRASFDLATCVYDSLNYLQTSDELLACFEGVAWALDAGGLFVGDMNTRWFLEHDWGECEVQEQPGYVQINRSHFDPANSTSTLLLTGFAGDDQRGYERFDEQHVERAYPPEAITALLEQAGLHVEATYDSFTFLQPTERTQRIMWIARKATVVGG